MIATVTDRIACNIRRLATKRHMTMQRLADFADVSGGHLSEVLRGKRSPTVGFLEKIATTLEVDIVELFRPQEDKEVPRSTK
jgi:transcriptional regulator with XRE-family HTH domain